MTGGKPSGYLQAWPGSWTRDYREQIQIAVRVAIELGAFVILALYTPLGYAASSRMHTVLAIPRSWCVCSSAYFASVV